MKETKEADTEQKETGKEASEDEPLAPAVEREKDNLTEEAGVSSEGSGEAIADNVNEEKIPGTNRLSQNS